MLKKVIYTLLIAIVSISLPAQELSLYQDYMFNSLYNLNSAAAGFDGNFVSQITATKKWLGISGSPSSQILSNSIRLGKKEYYDKNNYVYQPHGSFINRVGLGFTIFNETDGPLRHTGALLAYAYHIPMRRGQLSFGISGVVAQHGLNNSEFKPVETNDPSLYTSTSEIVSDANVGLLFYNRKLFAGISINGLININRTMDHTTTTPNMVVCGGYKLTVSGQMAVEPSIFVTRDGLGKITTDINAKLYYLTKYWLFLSYKTNRSMETGIAMQLSTGLQLSYAYAVSTSGLTNTYLGSHNISLRVDVAALRNKNNRR